MAGTEGDVVKQIAAYRENLRLKSERSEKERNQQIEEKERRHAEALAQSFLTFQPIMEPMLQKIADTYLDEAGLPLDQPYVRQYEPVVSDSAFTPGHFALIWGTPIPDLTEYNETSIEEYRRLGEKLRSGTKLSSKKRSHYMQQLEAYGRNGIEISGFNILVVVADLVEGQITPYHPRVWLKINNEVALTPEAKKSFWDTYGATHGTMIPALSKALYNPSHDVKILTNVQEFVTIGPKNIGPIGPFV